MTSSAWPAILLTLLLSWSTAAFSPCPATSSSTISSDCSWSTAPAPAAGSQQRVVGAAASLPALRLPQQPDGAGGGAAAAGYALVLQRVIVAGAELSPPRGDGGVPVLWPLGLYKAPGSSLLIADVRLLVSAAQLQAYLQELRQLPRAVAQWHSDNTSFVHISGWTSRLTTAHSVTLLSGPCLAASPADPGPADPLPLPWPAALAAAGGGGCGVRAVTNASQLVRTLQQDARAATPAPLLVLLSANASLGAGLRPGAINVARPVLLVGLWSVPTSIDLGATVNQINVTAKHAHVFWQSVFLENCAPGDAVSSILSRPMSSAVSANVYALYCDRSHVCLDAQNTTLVLASQAEMDYLQYMYSTFHSPLPSMRKITAFYHTEIKVTLLEMGPGPGGVGMRLFNMTCIAWNLVDCVFTTSGPGIAPRLPFPDGAPTITQSTRAGPLVQAVHDCESLQSSMAYQTIETRLHVWMLLSNVSLRPACWARRNVSYPTQVYGQAHNADVPSPGAGSGAGPGPGTGPGPVMRDVVYALEFGYTPAALLLPPRAEDKYLQFHNTTLAELPQGPNAAAGTANGRLLPDTFTLLIWSINRTMRPDAAPLALANVQLVLPQPEYDFIASRAEAASSFVVQLAGPGGDMTFTSASADRAAGRVRIGTFDGPGISGSSLLLLQAPPASQAAASRAPREYVWPADAAAAPVIAATAPPHDARGVAVVSAVVGAVVGAVGLLALLGGAWLWRRSRRRRRRQALAAPVKQADESAHGAGAPSCASISSNGGTPHGTGVGPPLPAALVAIGARSSPGKAAAGQADALAGGRVAAGQGSNGLPPASSKSGTSPPASAGVPASSANASSTAATSQRSSDRQSSQDSAAMLGLERWKQAVSSTTLQLMERRLASSHALPAGSAHHSLLAPSAGGGLLGAAAAVGGIAAARGARAPDAAQASAASSSSGSSQQHQGLQLHRLLGQGSFGSVWLGTWHGKRVAVKLLQLPATGLLAAQAQAGDRQGAQQLMANNSPPSMAIMEAVVSSTMAHPNVVQVFTYALQPLTLGVGEPGGGDENALERRRSSGPVSSWELKIVMEYCSEGTLRDALDARRLQPAGSSRGYVPAGVVLSLAHDVAAALLHLHLQGVTHGDIKAANVMLTRAGERDGAADAGDKADGWPSSAGPKLCAKLSDFGLALPLDPNNTHATLAARGTPTHMSPELFLSGHVSKASDVYAFGILLYELMCGQRAFTGVPMPLLPHEVAIKGARPVWPPDLPLELEDLRTLAQACWGPLPATRPSAADIFSVLEALLHAAAVPGGELPPALLQLRQRGQRQLEQQLEQQLKQQAQHAERAQLPPEAAMPAAAAPAGGLGGGGRGLSDLSWSEVSYGPRQ